MTNNVCPIEPVSAYFSVAPCPIIQGAAERMVDLVRGKNQSGMLILNDYLVRFQIVPEEKGAIRILYRKRQPAWH